MIKIIFKFFFHYGLKLSYLYNCFCRNTNAAFHLCHTLKIIYKLLLFRPFGFLGTLWWNHFFFLIFCYRSVYFYGHIWFVLVLIVHRIVRPTSSAGRKLETDVQNGVINNHHLTNHKNNGYPNNNFNSKLE